MTADAHNQAGRQPRRLAGVVVGLCLLSFALSGVRVWGTWDRWVESDVLHDLHVARRIHTGQGFTASGPERFHTERGMDQHPETNRQPLYCYLLAPLATPGLEMLAPARAVNLALSLVFLVALYFGVRLMWGRATALGTVLLVSQSNALLYSGAEATPEVLAALCCLGCLGCLHQGEKGWGWWGGAGACMGLAWLTRGTGTILLLPLVVGAWYLQAPVRARLGGLGLALAGFVVVAAPLLYRNATEFGNPLYNMNTAHAIWTDRWDVAGGGANMLYPSAEAPTLRSYLAGHSAGEMARREAEGLRLNTASLMDGLRLRAPGLGHWSAYLTGLPLLALALLGLAGERRRELRARLAWPLAAMWLALGWYWVISGPTQRLWFALSWVWFALAAAALVRLWGGRRVRPGLVVGLLALVLAVRVAEFRQMRHSPLDPPRLTVAEAEAVAWQEEHFRAGEAVIGTSVLRTETFIPHCRSWVELRTMADRWGVHWIVLSGEERTSRAEIFGEFFTVDPRDGQSRLRRVPEWWELAYQTPEAVRAGGPVTFIFRRVEPQGPSM